MTSSSEDAVERYVATFRAFSENGGRNAPAWLREAHRAAMARFTAVGFPNRRAENWRFTDVRPIAETPFELAPLPEAGSLSSKAVVALMLGVTAPRAVFVNGHYVAELSSSDSMPAGVELGSLRAALVGDRGHLQEHLTRYASSEENPFTALSTAFTQDGAFLHVPRDVAVDSPIHVLFVATPDSGAPLVSHPRNLFTVERGARAAVVESYVMLGDGVYWTNVVTEVVLGENANLEAYRLQRESVSAYHTATTQSCQARDSVYSSVTVALGGALSRHDINAVLDGEGARCTLTGLSVLAGRQHVDHHTTIDHAQPHCNSWEYFNGIFNDRARGVFNGRIMVRPGAQRTDAKQTNNNLLLSERARADSQPQLEIYADDVKCTHGATLGPIDERQLFYLKSRGLGHEEARQLLTYGFSSEILNTVAIEELRVGLDGVIRDLLAGGGMQRVSA